MAVREGKWKCPSCATVNRGPVTNCTGCGFTRDASVKFFLDDDAPVVTDPALLARAAAGADWVCGFCNNTNPKMVQTCSSCGAPASEGKAKAHGNVVPAAGVAPTTIPVAAAAAMPAPPPLPGGPKAPPAKMPMACLVLLPVLLLACCFGTWTLNKQHEDTATVTAVAWKRTIQVEAIKPVQESQWDSAPPGARDVTHRREQRTTRRVQTGTRTVMKDQRVQTGTKKVVVGHKDLGNGLFEDVTKDEPVYENRKVPVEEPVYREEPVYGEKYFYTVDKWVPDRTVRAEGTTDPPTWPESHVTDPKTQREKARLEEYHVTFLAKERGAPATLKVKGADAFAKFKPGSTWSVRWNKAGAFKVLGPSGQEMPELSLEAEEKKP